MHDRCKEEIFEDNQCTFSIVTLSQTEMISFRFMLWLLVRKFFQISKI